MLKFGQVLFLFILSANLLAGAGCADRADSGTPVSSADFFTRVDDVNIDFSIKPSPLRASRIKSQILLLTTSWLETSNSLYEWAYLSQSPEMMSIAQKLSETFYSFPYASSKMRKDQTPYSSLAFDAINEKMKDKKTPELIKTAVAQAADEVVIDNEHLQH
jgi:hypothetical protein